MDIFTVGIDLGTTNSALAVLNEQGLPEIVLNREGKKLTPSVVQVAPDGTQIVGEEARNALELEADSTAMFFKRDMGTNTTYWYRGSKYTPVDLSAAVLKKLCIDTAERTGKLPTHAVITVPAYFQDRAREATIEAARRAHLQVIQILNEPTAAVLFYGTKPSRGNRAREEVSLVYDLGGGTFDISVAKVTPDSIDIIATGGNQRLGGKDWDDRLVTLVCREFLRVNEVDPRENTAELPMLAARCEEVKKQLSSLTKTVLTIHCARKIGRIEVTRSAFEENTRDLLEQTGMLMDLVVQEADLQYTQINRVLLVGGSTRMPMCSAMIAARTGLIPDQTMNPDDCVALGAALRAHQLTAASGVTFKRMADVMGHSMGMIAVSADGERYVNSILISKNQGIPCRNIRSFRANTQAARENTITVYLTQGESADPGDCEFAARFVISGVPHRQGGQILDIGYEYDRDGVIAVSAIDPQTGGQLPVRKEPVPADMGWIFGSPKKLVQIQRTIYSAVDLSGSMSGEPLKEVQAALRSFVHKIDPAVTPFGLISFADTVRVNLKATRDPNRIESAITGLTIGQLGYGNSADPFDEAARLFPADGPRYLLVLTDGVWAYREKAVFAARKCHARGIEIIAIGYGGVDRDFLRSLCTTDEDVFSAGHGSLVGAFDVIAQELGVRDPGVGGPNQLTVEWKPSEGRHG